MPRGRPPKPVSLHRLEGTFDASRHARRAAEPAAPGELAGMRPPEWMTKRQRVIWSSVLGRAPKGLLRAIDYEVFAQYIELVDRYERAIAAQAQLDARNPEAPMLVKGSTGVVMSPYIRIIDRTVLLMARLQSELGFTPVGRARLGEPDKPREPTGSDSWGVLRTFPVIQGGKGRGSKA
jgi:P27 family predicted phage terminase small subunit